MSTGNERLSTARTDGPRYAAASDRGRVRADNQDAWAVDRELGLFIVCDGIGGHLAGEVASSIVTQSLPAAMRRGLPSGASLSSASTAEAAVRIVAELSRQVRQESQGQPGLDGMGTTVVCALVRDREALVVHLGDSRAYLLRGATLARLTSDHSVVQALIDAGQLSAAGADSHPAAGRLTRYLGMEGQALPQARHLGLMPGDRLLLCTDGLSGMLDEGQLTEILCGEPDPTVACRRLIAAANQAGGRDNITALLVAVGAG
jgi:serine/threonine protein phosphatase PrpC